MGERHMARNTPSGPGNLVFGPVPSRRLGRSLGVNNIPPKICSYACVYCQVGQTLSMQTTRESFYTPDALYDAVAARLDELRVAGDHADYISIVPDGEPTLDAELGATIRRLRTLGPPVAVITNGSLLSREDVRDDLAESDWVSVKVDAVLPDQWRSVDRPSPSLKLDEVLSGIRTFAASCSGELATETMLVASFNDDPVNAEAVSHFIADLSPATAYISIPTRPPARKSIRTPDEGSVTRVYEQFAAALSDAGSPTRVELLTGYEGNAFSSTGNPEVDLLSITAVHPMTQEAVGDLLARTGDGWEVVDRLVRDGALHTTEYAGKRFYSRRFHRR